jgi:CheY-like chemotaxis protein/signal transduction histidine kinase
MSATHPESPPQILVVDDTPENLQIVGETLSRNVHCDLAFATDGRQALDSVRESPPDIVLLDVMMPGMTGYEVCKRLKADPATAAIPVLFLTAKVESADVVAGFEAGAVDYVAKPFNPPELVARVKTQINIRQAAAIVAARTDALNESLDRLAESEAFLRTTIQALTHPFAVINADDYTIEMANAAYCGDNVPCRKCYEVSHHRDSPYCGDNDPCPLAEVKRTGKSITVEHLHHTPAGGHAHVEIHAYPVFDRDGRVARIIEYAIDVTERKHAEAERLRQESEIRKLQKTDSLNRMAGAVAHNFNNQLQAVMGNLELVSFALQDGTDPHELLSEAVLATRKASELSQLMLTYLGQIPGKYVPADLAAICRDHLPALFARRAASMRIETHLPDPGPVALANQPQILQLLDHLCVNAQEAIGASPGTVVLRVDTVDSASLPATNRFPLDWTPQFPAYARLQVADTGQGIPPEDVDRIFDPFYSTKFTGRGMGLPVVLGIARSHNGAISVEANSPRGTLFNVYLPLASD